MTNLQATAKIFTIAFKSLSNKEKRIIVENLLRDKAFKEDLIDIAIIEQRKKESSRSFRGYMASRKKNH